jgi:hypothetical protein
MPDWQQMARAVGIERDAEDLARTLAPLEPLQKVFDALAATLRPEDEPAVLFTPVLESDPQ